MFRIFVGIKLPQELKESITSIQEKLKEINADVKWVEPENFHFNLKFFGNVTENELEKIKKITQSVSSFYSPFELEINGIKTFPSQNAPRVIWLGTKKGTMDIISLAEHLESEFVKAGFEAEFHKFQPHLTIGRVRSAKNRKELVKKIKEIENINIGTFKADEIIIFQSKLSPQGPTYTEVSKYRIGD